MIHSHASRLSALASLLLVASLAHASGCSLLVSPDEDLIPGAGGSGGQSATGGGGQGASGGEGGAGAQGGEGGAGAQGGAGGAGGEGGQGGQGGGCSDPTECPGTDTECRTRTCEGGVCGFDDAPQGTVVSSQVASDCQRSICDGAGALSLENDATDILDDLNDCTTDTCEDDGSGTLEPSNAPSSAGATCSSGGGVVCDGAGACVECVDGGDCTSGVCTLNVCVPAECNDTVLNGDETDVDCGGSICSPCADGDACMAPGDCESGVCTSNVCQVPACNDTVDNGDETDVDCGGATCSPCGPGLGCSVDDDCVGGACSGSVCLPTCTDGVTNAMETDVDCGGPTCATCADGEICSVAGDCDSGVCDNGSCAVPSCTDLVSNGTETGTDCGGGVCPVCANGGGCSVGGDCASGVCDNGSCAVPSCTDGVTNGTETGLDCGGACPACAAGSACGVAADCQSSVCTGNVCQAPACGDGVLQGTEACDDGNQADGDCCSAACQIEAGCEVEPNNACGQVNAIPLSGSPLTGSVRGAVSPASDGDFYSFTLTAPSSVRLETYIGTPGTCGSTSNNDTFVELRGADCTSILGSDDDDGVGFCSLVNPATDAFARTLPAGTYHARVRHSSTASPVVIANYTLVVTVASQCGDGTTTSPFETCDDGNLANGDGCSATCTIESLPETEPNNTCATASGPFAVPATTNGVLVGGAISPAADNDWYSFTLPSRADVRIETFDANGPTTCASIDTVIQAFQSDCTTQLGAAKDQGGVANCSRIDPSVDTYVRQLPAGTYRVRANAFSATATFNYTMQVRMLSVCGNSITEGFEQCDGGPTCSADCTVLPVCGDGVLATGEGCEDGNLVDNDGCSSTCTVEAGWTCGTALGASAVGTCFANCGDSATPASGGETCDDGNRASGDACDSACRTESAIAEIEANGTFAEADAVAITLGSGSETVSGAISPVADLDTYRLVLAADSVVRFETFDGSGADCAGGMTTTLRLFNAAQTQIYTDNLSGIANCSAIVARLVAGTYYVRVEELGNNAAIAAYRLQVKVQTDTGSESETNETLATADKFVGSDVYVFGGHQVNADLDTYVVTVPAGRSLRAEVIEGSTAETCESNGIDSRLRLFNAAGTDVGNDDDDGRGFCSLIDGTGTVSGDTFARNLAGGTYYLRVEASSPTGTTAAGQFDYRLVVTIR